MYLCIYIYIYIIFSFERQSLQCCRCSLECLGVVLVASTFFTFHSQLGADNLTGLHGYRLSCINAGTQLVVLEPLTDHRDLLLILRRKSGASQMLDRCFDTELNLVDPMGGL